MDGLRGITRDPDGDPALGGADRRARGQYGTPPLLAAWVAREVLGPLGPGARILDPSAGDGRFLAAARAVQIAAGEDAAQVEARLIGFERDPELAAVARARLPRATIVTCEALCASPPVEVDAVIGNPPYVRSIRLRAADPALWAAVRGRFAATSHGEWDLYGAFIERALAWVRPGGRIGLITPSRWWSAAFAIGLRAEVAARVRAIVDFGAAQVFPGATTYAAVTILERGAAPSAAPIGEPIAVARLERGGWQTGTIAGASLGAAPWRFAVGAAARAVEACAARGPALGALARIVKGAGTNADGVFVIEAPVVRGAQLTGRTIAGAIAIEAAATRPCLRGRDIGAASRPACVVPYERAALIPWAILQRRWPAAATYLEAQRAILEARERGRFTGDRFHAFGRAQNLAFHADLAAKVVVPDVARAGRALIDTTGALVLDSAYAIRPRVDDGAYDAALLALVLGSPIIALWLAHAGVPLRGGYVRLKTAYLAPLPLPPPGPALDAVRAAIPRDRAAALEALRAAYGLDAALWRDQGAA